MDDAAIREAGSAGGLPPCPACREDHYRAVALPCWNLVGPDPDGDPELRLYRHPMDGEERVVAPLEMYRKLVRPAWIEADTPPDPVPPRHPVISGIYLLAVETAIGPALKVGHSCDVIRRAEAFGDATAWPSDVVQLPRRDVRAYEERELHRSLVSDHPDLVLTPEQIGRRLPCVSEVYRPEAKDIVIAAFREIAARYACYDGRHGVIAPAA